MQITLIVLLAIHVLSAVFWAGSTFTLARSGGVGSDQLFRPQMGAAAVVFLTGAALWAMSHSGALSTGEVVLLVGIGAAFVAAGIQGALRRRPEIAHRAAAGLLALTTVAMAISRYVA